MLQINELKTYYFKDEREIKAVDGVRLKIPESTIFAIVGESGCGKTTLGLSITNLIDPRDGKIVYGSVVFQGKNILRLSEAELCDIRGKKISYIFQEPASSFNPVFTIGEQIKEALLAHRMADRNSVSEVAVTSLKDAGLPETERILKSYPHQLSGGMKQRAMIAMAISTRPKLLVADEPTTALDIDTESKILDLLISLREKLSLSIVIITHNIGMVRRIADVTAVMYKGKIVELAETDRLFNNPKHPYTKLLIDSIPERKRHCEADEVSRSNPMIEVIDIKKYYKDVKALDGVNLKIDYGESVGVVGRSGCGKTTLAKIIARLIRPTSGKVLYGGEDVFKMKKKSLKRFRQKVQIVFQDPYASLNPKMRIKDILSEPFIIHKKAPKRRRMQKVRKLLKKVGLKNDILDSYPHQLSGGMRQRVNIARALSVEPKLLICDEPVSSLDLPIQARILKLLAKLKREENLALLFISHDPAVIKVISDRVLKLGN